jgi:hypothetical protein
MSQQPDGDERERLMAEFKRRNGEGTYNARAHGKSMADRKTRPVTQRYYLEVTGGGECQMCDGRLEMRANPSGGFFHVCSEPGCEYYIGTSGEKIK